MSAIEHRNKQPYILSHGQLADVCLGKFAVSKQNAPAQVNWAVDPDERTKQVWFITSILMTGDLTKQIQSVFMETLEPEANLYIRDAEDKQAEIDQLEITLREKVNSYSMTAYNSLEAMVQSLLLIDNGEKTYKNLHADVIGALDDCTDKFSQLSIACKDSVHDFGNKAGDCMELKDSIGRFISELKTQMDQVNGPVDSIMERKQERDQNLDKHRQREQVLAQQLRDIQSSSSVGENALATTTRLTYLRTLVSNSPVFSATMPKMTCKTESMTRRIGSTEMHRSSIWSLRRLSSSTDWLSLH